MPFEPLTTKISIGEVRGQNLANLTLEDARFYGRPNFSGEMNQFKDSRRQFTVLIPNELADQLRALGWNVKTSIMKADEPNPSEWEPTSSLKVMVGEPGDSTTLHLLMKTDEGMIPEMLTSQTMGILDRSRVVQLDMEIRAWNYNKEEFDAGLDAEKKYSARLVSLVAVIDPSLLQRKYGALI